MKKIKLLVVFAVLIACSQIGLSQTEKTYDVDAEGNLIEVKSEKQIELCFEYDVPKLTEQQATQLWKDGKIQVSREVLKGHYELGILFYVPRVEADSCFLAEDGTVSYKSFQTKDQPKMFSWWFLFAVVGTVCIVLARTLRKDNIAAIFAFVAVFMAMFMFVFIAVFMTPSFLVAVAAMFVFMFALVFALVLVFMENKKNKKIANVFAWLYYVCIVPVCLFTYLQW